MDQVRVERRTANTTHKRDAEESRQEALARKKAHHKHAVNENRKAMVDEVIIPRVNIWTHEEEASVKCEEQKRLSNATYIILFEDIKNALVVKAVKHHAKQVFKNAYRRKHVEKAVLGIETIKP